MNKIFKDFFFQSQKLSIFIIDSLIYLKKNQGQTQIFINSPLVNKYNDFKSQDTNNHELMDFKFEGSGFINAFNNFISYINNKDFYEFATQTCDPMLVEGFKNGMKKLKAYGKNVEIVNNPSIKEEMLFTRPILLAKIDQDISYYSQAASEVETLNQMRVEIYTSEKYKEPLCSMIIGCHIKSATSLKIKGFDTNPSAFHFVEFQLIKDPNTQAVLGLNWIFSHNSNHKVFCGDNYEWRIINIDGFLKKAN